MVAKKKAERVMYDAEFQQKAVDAVAAGRPVVEVAAELGIKKDRLYYWIKHKPWLDKAAVKAKGKAKKSKRPGGRVSEATKRAALGEIANGAGMQEITQRYGVSSRTYSVWRRLAAQGTANGHATAPSHRSHPSESVSISAEAEILYLRNQNAKLRKLVKTLCTKKGRVDIGSVVDALIGD